jgi:tetratricopeptide (TPR) repeat protein
MNISMGTFDESYKQRVNHALGRKNTQEIEELIKEVNKLSKRKERNQYLELINTAVLKKAFEENHPELLRLLIDLSHTRIFETMNRAIHTYTATKDPRWYEILFDLSEKLDRKSYQSKIFAKISKELIEAGVEAKDADLILKGIDLVQHIGFRKYQSDIMIDIVPLIIVWAIETRDVSLLNRSLDLISVVGDISKHSLLRSELAKAMATIGTLQNDVEIVIGALKSGAEIKQKHSRLSCILAIIEKLWKSGMARTVTDVEFFIRRLADIPEPQQVEILGTLSEFLIERTRDKRQLQSSLEKLADDIPLSREQIILKLLEKAEKSADRWYMERGLEFNARFMEPEHYPIREIVRSGTAVAARTKDISVLMQIIPLLDKTALAVEETLLSQYLAIVDSLLAEGDLHNALDLFSKIISPFDRTSKHAIDTSVHLIKEGILHKETDLLKKRIFSEIELVVANPLIQRAVLELCKESEFTDFISFARSFEDIVTLHENKDSLIFDCIKILIERGFMEYNDPSVLLHLTEQIGDKNARETAISFIVIEMAKIGVFLRNRDILQRAVGLTCQIEGQRPRSEALSRIIDQASFLAVEQGDLDFLHRMGAWIRSLLEKDYEVYARDSIIEGMIKYGVSQNAPHALDDSYQLTSTLEDPNLMQRKRESIIEGFIRIGCATFIETGPGEKPDFVRYTLTSFERALALMRENIPKPQRSLKLSRYIDLILEQAETSKKLDFIIPLTLFILEIGDPQERNAMFYRVATFFRGLAGEEETTNPNEVMLRLFGELEYAYSSPVVMDLIYRLIDQTALSYSKLSSLCNLADAYMRIREMEKAQKILTGVHVSLKNLSDIGEQIVILTNLVGLLARVDEKQAYECLNEALDLLEEVSEERSSPIRKQIIFSVISLHALNPKEEHISLALQLVNQIKDPVEFVNSLISIFGMALDDAKRKEILASIYQAIGTIPSPYDRATMLLDLVPLAERYGRKEDALSLLEETETVIHGLNIPFIATIIRRGIVQMLYMLYTKRNDPVILTRAKEIASHIEDEEMRKQVLLSLGVEEKDIPVSPNYANFLEFRSRILSGRFTAADAEALHRTIKSLYDRAERAKFYTLIAIACRMAGQMKLGERMLQHGVDEASIIRPLSRRAFVLGDMALSMYIADDEDRAKDILGLAVDAAINIREEEHREDVFDELSVALRIIEEHLL